MNQSHFDKLLEEIASLEYKGAVDPVIYKSRAKILGRKYLPERSYVTFEKEINGTFGAIISTGSTPDSVFRKNFTSSKRLLAGIVINMKYEYGLLSNEAQNKPENEKVLNLKDVFIVHGHDNEMVQAVARVLEKLDLNPIILREKADKGRTIIKKFEDHSDVDFAIVLLSPEDKFYVDPENLSKVKYRSRQNVILELGFFIGKLGRSNLVALYRKNDNYEFPSDIDGVIYQEFIKGWEYDVADELVEFGFNIDKNKI